VQAALRSLLPPDAILVGQSLNSDLNALKMMHPFVIGGIFILTFLEQALVSHLIDEKYYA
jgi:hypothetical protein